ncbi:hypothetical protein A6A28_16255 [Streptomyces sp. CB03578]|uniref:hypothetical protein n=1 Tax=Streptomyces sp. CB03578 TaxID=1718987 RepID=UPI00094039C8|nr:hypothetical protein [Streptomyces sp. CB03578]OKI26542.1 hypothetical protein A6A28_16255 [Streptomyces sp. CB03578]
MTAHLVAEGIDGAQDIHGEYLCLLFADIASIQRLGTDEVTAHLVAEGIDGAQDIHGQRFPY